MLRRFIILSKYYNNSTVTYVFDDELDTFAKALRKISYDIEKDFCMVMKIDDSLSERMVMRTFNQFFLEHMATRN